MDFKNVKIKSVAHFNSLCANLYNNSGLIKYKNKTKEPDLFNPNFTP